MILWQVVHRVKLSTKNLVVSVQLLQLKTMSLEFPIVTWSQIVHACSEWGEYKTLHFSAQLLSVRALSSFVPIVKL